MIRSLRTFVTEGFDPYDNLAREAYLTSHARAGEVVLYLWQNDRTVVVGRNQNCFKECRVALLEAEGGHLARRPSGGGAVYHDRGNLNFSFVARREDYDVGHQLSVILHACRALGIPAEATGRNDLTVSGKKFSGNAFLEKRAGCCHHGTILIHADTAAAERYLSASREKLASKGVASVRARIANLADFRPGLTVPEMRAALFTAFESVYGLSASLLAPEDFDPGALASLRESFASDAWRYGEKLDFTYEISRRFLWGGLTLLLRAEDGAVARCRAESDAMDADFIAALAPALEGVACRAEPLAQRVLQLGAGEAAWREDVASMLREAL
ncbi:MAG TPA: lipoate--protein ligase [Oscillospiraceae bacterium]|nr:lipoate--protein ligase [Oscillospiraceae bacterium]